MNSSLSSVHVCSSRTVHRSHAQLILPDVLEPILPIRFRPMPGLISSTVGFEFSNVIFIQFSHNLDRVSNCTVLIPQREECVAALIGTHTYMYIAFSFFYSICNSRTVHIYICCMKPYNIKGAAMPIYAILARVTDIGTVHVEHGTGQSSRSTLMVKSSYLARPIAAIPRHLPVHGSVVTWS